MEDVLTDVRRITDVCDAAAAGRHRHRLRRSAFNVARTVRVLIKAGAGAMHIEDQVGAKRCGHRPGKEVVSWRDGRPREGGGDARTDPAS
jgi:methylisocitrate lyase